MKPVEIEFLMKDNLTGGLDKAGLAPSISLPRNRRRPPLPSTPVF